MSDAEFGTYLKMLRRSRNMTIRQLEVYSGVSNAHLSLLENGKRRIPKPDVLRKLAKALHVPYTEMLAHAGYLSPEETDCVVDLPTDGFGRRLQSLRKGMKLTQEDVATRLSITRSTYAKYETGENEPSFYVLSKLCDLFGVSVDYLLRGRVVDCVDYRDHKLHELLNTWKELSNQEKDIFVRVARAIAEK